MNPSIVRKKFSISIQEVLRSEKVFKIFLSFFLLQNLKVKYRTKTRISQNLTRGFGILFPPPPLKKKHMFINLGKCSVIEFFCIIQTFFGYFLKHLIFIDINVLKYLHFLYITYNRDSWLCFTEKTRRESVYIFRTIKASSGKY